jgi:O-glycosyl hydrolase
VDIDTALRHQVMDGWGASSNFYEENLLRYDTASRRRLFDLVCRDLGANILCIRLYPAFQSAPGAPWNWECMAAQRMIVGEALARGVIGTIWLKISSPPGWMKDNGSDWNGGHLLPAHRLDLADYLSAYLRGMRDRYGIRIDAVSIFNEPGFKAAYESTETTPEEYVETLKIVHAAFARDGLGGVALIGPETGHITAGRPYVTAPRRAAVEVFPNPASTAAARGCAPIIPPPPPATVPGSLP